MNTQHIAVNKVHLFAEDNFSRPGGWFKSYPKDLEVLASSIATRGYDIAHGVAKVYKLEENNKLLNRNDFEVAKAQRQLREEGVDLEQKFVVDIDGTKVEVSGLEFRNACAKYTTTKPSHGLVAQFGRFSALQLANVALEKSKRPTIDKVPVQVVGYQSKKEMIAANIAENGIHSEGRRELSKVDILKGIHLMFKEGATQSECRKVHKAGTGAAMFFLCQLDQKHPELKCLDFWYENGVPPINHQKARQLVNMTEPDKDGNVSTKEEQRNAVIQLMENPKEFLGKKIAAKAAPMDKVRDYASNRTKSEFVTWLLEAVTKNDLPRLAKLDGIEGQLDEIGLPHLEKQGVKFN